MSSQIEDMQRGEARYYGMLTGTVADVTDPLGLHRVRANVPGIAEPTDWLFPITSGGGSPERGSHVAPDVSADVCIWFHMGDPNGMGVYACGWWGVPDDGPETTHEIKTNKSEAHLIQTLRLGRIIATVDERPGKEAFRVYDAKGGFDLTVDLETKRVRLKGLVGLTLESAGQLVLDGLEVLIKGRRVNDTSSPI